MVTRGYKLCNLSMMEILVHFVLFLNFLSSVCTQTMILRYDIRENKAPGTFVGNVPHDAGLRSKYDDRTYRTLRYSFLKQPRTVKNMFTISKTIGDIKVAKDIDREALCNGSDTCDFTFDVAAVDASRRNFNRFKVIITIQDDNDHTPTFPVQSLELEVLETVAPGTSIASIPNAADDDSGFYGIQEYTLTKGVATMFELSLAGPDYRTGEIFLVLKKKLDREQNDLYTGTIRASDAGHPQKVGEISIRIRVIDGNDNKPVFDRETYEFSVEENIRIPALIGQIRASDRDIGSNGDIIYKFGDQTFTKYGRLFKIDRTSGQLTAIGQLDYERQAMYYLTVIAADRGNNPHSAETTVLVRLTDYNDNAPVVSVSTMSNTPYALIKENIEVGTFVAHLKVNDRDSGENGEFSCWLDSQNFTLISYSEKEYQILTKTVIDREKMSFFNLSVVCRDQGAPQRSRSHTVGVKILDENDNEPVFTASHYNFTLMENNYIGQEVGRVTAIDPDDGENSKLSYRLNSAASLFSIGKDTGIIVAEYKFNFEHYQKVTFNVTVEDNGKKKYSAMAQVSVYVRDTNDKKPIFSEPHYVFEVFENEPFWTFVGEVHALDGDSHMFNNISYTLIPSPNARDLFAISLDTGAIHTRKTLDREKQALYHLTVVAENRGYAGMSSTVRVSVVVKDRNDHYPRFLFPTEENHTVLISPQLPSGYTIARITARDADAAENGHVTYNLTKKVPQFTLHSSTGILSVGRNLARYTDKRYELTVTAADGGNPARTSKMLLEIIVNASVPLPAALTGGPLGENFIIIVSLSAACGIAILVLLIAIICTWHRRRNRWYKADPSKDRTEQTTVLSQNVSSDSQSSDSPSHVLHNKYNDSTLQYKQSFPVVTEETGDPHDETTYLPPPPPEMQGEIVEISTPSKCVSPFHPDPEQEVQFHHVRFKTPNKPNVYEQYHPQPNFLKPPNHEHSRSHNTFTLPALHLMRHSPDAGSGSSVDSGHGPSEEGTGFGDLHVLGQKPHDGRMTWNYASRRSNTTDV